MSRLAAILAAVIALVFPSSPPAPTPPSPPAPFVRMTASYYGPGFHGRPTASGSLFDRFALTTAHRTLPFGTRLKLTYPVTGRSVEVTVNDRGPYAEWKGVRYFEGRRDLDVSEGVAELLGFKERGLARLRVQFLGEDNDAILSR